MSICAESGIEAGTELALTIVHLFDLCLPGLRIKTNTSYGPLFLPCAGCRQKLIVELGKARDHLRRREVVANTRKAG